MLYILPPPRNPSPPSPWESILYRPVNNSGEIDSNNASDKNKVQSGKKTKIRTTKKGKDGLTGQNDMDTSRNPKSLSECYFAGKGTALVLPDAEAKKTSQGNEDGSNRQSTNIQVHLQSMFYLLRPEETLKMAVKLESNHPARTRYLVVVSRMGNRGEESCLLGIDCNEKTTVGLVLKVLADTAIRLDGDGGFSVSVCGRYHIFKPVSVAAMWSALQTLHKVSSKARDQNYFLAGGLNHQWVDYYERRIESDRSCLNEWHAMDQLESRRPPSPDSIRTKPHERDETERVIRTTLKEIMMSVDLDEVTSKYIRTRLEEDLDVDLGEYKSFIDQEMLTILGQMDAPTLVFEHVYLGSEWNASNFDELKKNGVGHILNVTKEIDNFFPGTFDYLNIRVYDDEKTDLLKHWDDTFKYITRAKNEGSKVLVHCKMGISRSASVVIAYAMKAYNWDFKTAWSHVKDKRTCIKPNSSFLAQLETYRGILDAMSNREKLQRSKSETNLKGGAMTQKISKNTAKGKIESEDCIDGSHLDVSNKELCEMKARPKSWSPDGQPIEELSSVCKSSPAFLSLEDLSQKSLSRESVQKSSVAKSFLPRHMLMPCDNGQSYSVSPNQIVHLPGQCIEKDVQDRVGDQEDNRKDAGENLSKEDKKPMVPKQLFHTLNEISESGGEVKDTWDPGENQFNGGNIENTHNSCDQQTPGKPLWISSTIVKTIPEPQFAGPLLEQVPEMRIKNPPTGPAQRSSDLFSSHLDSLFDREEKRQQRVSVIPVLQHGGSQVDTDKRESPSRQNSWSSYDSAVAMSGTETLSRHSSWGSGDTRTLPSRNSSWGSYDTRPRCNNIGNQVNEKGEISKNEEPSRTPVTSAAGGGLFPYEREDIPWLHGTVKRTRQKLEDCNIRPRSDDENATKTRQTTLLPSSKQRCQSVAITIAARRKSDDSRHLSASAPETRAIRSTLVECSLTRRQSSSSEPKNIARSQSERQASFLENLRKNKTEETPDSGIVRHLKREFEAKTTCECGGIVSVPPSPEKSPKTEDLNLKNLIGLFENRKNDTQKSWKDKPKRFSCIEIEPGDPKKEEFKRPPPVSVVRKVAATVIATAAKKQQQFGKSHPLARLSIKPRHNNPVYNTM